MSCSTRERQNCEPLSLIADIELESLSPSHRFGLKISQLHDWLFPFVADSIFHPKPSSSVLGFSSLVTALGQDCGLIFQNMAAKRKKARCTGRASGLVYPGS